MQAVGFISVLSLSGLGAVRTRLTLAAPLQVAGSRTEGAQAALSEAKTRRAEVQKIEETLVELAMLFTQVSELVASQDQQFITVEDTTRMIEEETGEGCVLFSCLALLV